MTNFKNVKVNFTYKGEPVNKDFLKNNPEIAKLYPSDTKFNLLHADVIRKTKPDMVSIINIDESGTSILWDKEKLKVSNV